MPDVRSRPAHLMMPNPPPPPESTAVDWQQVCQEYLPLDRCYLDTACKGIPAPEVEAAVRDLCRLLRVPQGRSATEDSVTLIESAHAARQEAAALIHADPSEIALVDSTQSGIITALDAIGLRKGDAVVTSDLEFLACLVPLRGLQSQGVEVVVVPHRRGCVSATDIADAVTARTRVVVLSSVQEVTGELLDLASLSRFCRAEGVYLVIDAAQHVGPTPLDVEQTPVDFLAVGGHKWLCSPFGLGFLYVRPELVGRLQPTLPGYMALATPDAGWAAFLADPHRSWNDAPPLATDARRFERGGTPNSVGATALATSIAALREIGLSRIQERTRMHVSRLSAELTELGLALTTPEASVGRSGIVSLSTGRGAEEDQRLLTRLLDDGVSVSLRYAAGVGGLRVSPYFYTTDDDVCRLVEVVRRHARSLISGGREHQHSRGGNDG